MENSYRTSLRSSSIMGGVSVATILISLLRMKVVAVLLGPAGVGLVGLFQSLVATAAAVSALGFKPAGTRRVAQAWAEGGADAVSEARRALFWGTLGLSVLGGAGFFLLRDVIAAAIVADPLRAADVGWLALGVVLTVAAASQSALLNGLRRIGDLARLQIASGILSTTVGVPALLLWGESGIVVFVLATPLASFVLGHWYVSKLGRIGSGATALADLAGQWRAMAGLGAALMVSGVATTAGHLTVRSLVQHELGPAALGQFQAAWAISATYLTFVLFAMGTDYYPRLAAAIRDPAVAVRLANEQTEVALWLAGPVVLAMLALAPVVIRLIYTSEFDAAADVLRWQLLGDVLKVTSLPLGFVLLASGAGKAFVGAETTGMGIFVVGTWAGLPLVGVTATGASFLAFHVCYLPLVYCLARRRIGFRWSRAAIRQLLAVSAAAAAVAALARLSDELAAGAGLAASAGFALYGLGRLGSMADLHGPVGRLSAVSRQAMALFGVRG